MKIYALIIFVGVMGFGGGLAVGYIPNILKQSAPESEEELRILGEIERDIKMLKMMKPGYRRAMLRSIDGRIAVTIGNLNQFQISEEQYLDSMWMIKDYVVEFQVAIPREAYRLLAELPIRKVGTDARYKPDVPLASEIHGMGSYDSALISP